MPPIMKYVPIPPGDCKPQPVSKQAHFRSVRMGAGRGTQADEILRIWCSLAPSYHSIHAADVQIPKLHYFLKRTNCALVLPHQPESGKLSSFNVSQMPPPQGNLSDA